MTSCKRYWIFIYSVAVIHGSKHDSNNDSENNDEYDDDDNNNSHNK